MKKTYRLKDLCCANCAAKVERAIQKIDGVQDASISFMAQRLILECDESALSGILEQVKAAIAKIEPDCRLIG